MFCDRCCAVLPNRPQDAPPPASRPADVLVRVEEALAEVRQLASGTPQPDVYSLALHAWYRLAGLLPHGFAGRGPQGFNFPLPPLRIYRPDLPTGIALVLARALERDPNLRHATIDDLVADLADAVERARQRRAWSGNLRCETGSATAIGRTHIYLDLPNQDAHTIVPLSPNRLAALVCDGVTTARIGSGELASQMAMHTIANHLRRAADPVSALTAACLEASAAIVARALQEAPAEKIDPYDLMSSTAVIAVLDGRLLHLANVGDSRAYLIANGRAEQLTVDGDVRCMHLARGAPPQAVFALGSEAAALITCLGVAEDGPDGVRPCVERTRPALSVWPLVPGDVVVLCSDGLVEEGVFLDPEDLPALVREGTAGEIAHRLVDAACAHHADPTPMEPLGRGDDVTCIVLRMHATP
jgi:protein phosphatase